MEDGWLGKLRVPSAMEARENVVVTLPRELASIGIPREDGEPGRTFNAVRMPEGTVVGGRDVSGYEVHPNFVNRSPLGEGLVEVPLQRGREVWLQRQLYDAEGRFVIDGAGHRARDTVKVDPGELAAAVRAARREPAGDARPLAQRAASARAACAAQRGGARAPAREGAPRGRPARDGPG